MIGNLAISRTKASMVRKAPLLWRIRNFARFAHLHGLFAVWIAWLASKLTSLPFVVGEWQVVIYRADGTVEDLGVVCRKVITDTSLVKFADALYDGSFSPQSFAWGGVGSGTTAPAAGDTALASEFTTQLTVDNQRTAVTKSKPTTTSVKMTFAATLDTTVSAAEFGIFSQQATGGGTLLDRGTMTPYTLGNGDGFGGVFTMTFARGS